MTQEDLSCLGRDYIMTCHYMERYFPEKRVRYISLLDGVDTGVKSSANDITPFHAIMNDMQAKAISRKIRSVKHDKQRKGSSSEGKRGKPTYGYKMHPTDKNGIVIDEEVAPVVRRIFAIALVGTSCRQIVVELNEEDLLPPCRLPGTDALLPRAVFEAVEGLIFCHERGYPLGVLNRKNTAGKERLFFVCHIHQ